MFKRVQILLMLALVGSSFATLVSFDQALAEPPANTPFENTWARTDKPVADGVADRTWMWGPEANTGSINEPYVQAPGGEREVQYFDKTRMEINDPAADPDDLWYVTNGLLATELITGRMQIGDNQFEDRQPADVQIAGDPDPNSPTYAMLNALLDEPPLNVGDPVTQWLGPNGQVNNDPGLESRGVTAAHYADVTGHTVASPFWDFMNSSGPVHENGQTFTDQLFENPFFATGLPITEAYWTIVPVAGEHQDVLAQCFERRCLTYTPDNPLGWEVEAANIGQHYFEWREPGTGPALSCNDVTQIPQHECEALVALYTSTNGDNWTENDGWLESDTPCNWHGIACEATSPETVTVIVLEDNDLAGELPGELADLANLQALWLAKNQLTGEIPPILGEIENLQLLALHDNELTGAIPSELAALSDMWGLTLGSNQLTGGIPPGLGVMDNLEILVLGNNELTGTIPEELGTLSNLEFLDLGMNQLTGQVPGEIGDLSALVALRLHNNSLSGPLPESLTSLSLEELWFYETDLCEPSNTEFQQWLAGIDEMFSTWEKCS